VDGVVEEAVTEPAVSVGLTPPPGSAEAAAEIRLAAERWAAAELVLASRQAEELGRSVSTELAQMEEAVRRRAEFHGATAASETDWIRSQATRTVENLLVAARADAGAALASARTEAAELVRAAAVQADHERAAAIEETDRRREEATAAAGALLAAAQAEAAAIVTAARHDLEAAVAARRTAERSARAFHAARQAAAEMALEAERALAWTRDERLRSDAGAAEVLATAFSDAAATFEAARTALDTSARLLTSDSSARGEPAPATEEAFEVDFEEVGFEEVAEVAVPAEPTKARPFLVPALTLKRELLLRMLAGLGVFASAWFWVWWLGPGHGRWTAGSVVVTVLMGWVFLLPSYFYFFICRMTRPNRELPLPDLRVAILVTKAPSEPWPVLQRTLEAMLAQEFDRPYDVWLADERPSAQTRLWCAEKGVQLSSREGVKEYQRKTWPRRKRSKEGNLAYFYDHFGYERYDVVAQLDADHIPSSCYLEEMVRPFSDPAIGYVSAPSICDANADQGWTVRGRLYREATMHGPIQAGSNDGFGPVCIGSHYAVRTAALREVGGVGPELAEDYSTTLFLQSSGWQGVFNIDAVAHGDGPESVDEMLRQELQWARSLGTILVRWAPARLGGVPWRARLRLGFALAFYPLQGLALSMAAVLPVVGVALRVSWGNTSLAGFYLHLWPSTLVGLSAAAYLRRCGLLRPTRAKLWSWELVLFQLVRWPWTFWGFLQGMIAGLRGRELSFKVTPKGRPGVKPLRLASLVPSLVLGVGPASVVILVRHPGPALGLELLAATQAVTYLSCAAAVVALHLASNRKRRGPGTSATASWLAWDSGGMALLVMMAVVVPTIAALVWRLATSGLVS